MEQNIKDLLLLNVLHEAYKEEFRTPLITQEWMVEQSKKVFGVQHLDQIDDKQLEANYKFFLNYEIEKLKRKLEEDDVDYATCEI